MTENKKKTLGWINGQWGIFQDLKLPINDRIRILLSRMPSQLIFNIEPQYGPLAIRSSSYNLLHALSLGAPVTDPPGQQASSKSTQVLFVLSTPLTTEVR